MTCRNSRGDRGGRPAGGQSDEEGRQAASGPDPALLPAQPLPSRGMPASQAAACLRGVQRQQRQRGVGACDEQENGGVVQPPHHLPRLGPPGGAVVHGAGAKHGCRGRDGNKGAGREVSSERGVGRALSNPGPSKQAHSSLTGGAKGVHDAAPPGCWRLGV